MQAIPFIVFTVVSRALAAGVSCVVVSLSVPVVHGRLNDMARDAIPNIPKAVEQQGTILLGKGRQFARHRLQAFFLGWNVFHAVRFMPPRLLEASSGNV